MAITLGSNIASLRGQRQLSRTSDELGTVFQRLSTGQRINKASDDAAGLSIADSLNARSRIYNQGARNLNDGLSLLSIADSAIENLADIVIRLEELAEQAANGVYTNKQRKAMDDEAQALSKEFFRISKTTEFNGQRLLAGDVRSIGLQAGVGQAAVLSARVGGAIGTGTFGAATSSVVFNGSVAAANDVVLGDLNGDGSLDMITVGGDYGYYGLVKIRLGTGSGTFVSSSTFYVGDGKPDSIALGDVNGDGVLDLCVSGYSGTAGMGARATVFVGRGDGTFLTPVSYAAGGTGFGEHALEIALGDLNSDGKLDMVTTGTSAGAYMVSVRLGAGNGTFGATTTYSTTDGRGLALGDLNGDGILDVATASGVRLGSGNGSFGNESALNFGGGIAVKEIVLGDLNGDGVLDIAAVDEFSFGGKIAVALGTGTGTFGSATQYVSIGASLELALGDFNGDGFLDITSGTTVHLNSGTGTFGSSTAYVMEPVSDAVAVGDVNGDGVLDMVTCGYEGYPNATATVRLGNSVDGVAPVLPFSVKTQADARQALPIFKRKREQLAAQRGQIGAYQSRIDVARTVLEVSSENFKAAESRIRDADIADESSRLVRLNILQQAAASVLAQANQQPSLALQLLR